MDQSSTRNDHDQYVDFIDVIIFVWKSKRFWLFGIVFGLVVTLGAVYLFTPPTYVSRIPVNVALATAQNAEGLAQRINDEMSSTLFAERVFETLSANKVSESSLKKLFDNREDFIDLQIKPKANSITPFRLVMRQSLPLQLYIETRFRRNDSDALVSVALAEAVISAAHEHNSQMQVSNEPAREMPAALTSVIRMKLKEEGDVAASLSSLEASLKNRLGESSQRTQTSLSELQDGPIDQIPRLAAELLQKQKINKVEFDGIVAQRTELLSEMRIIKAKYELSLKEAELDLNAWGENQIDTLLGRKLMLPDIVIDQRKLEEAKRTNSLQTFDAKPLIAVAFGSFMGGLIGLIFCGMLMYFQKRRSRFAAL